MVFQISAGDKLQLKDGGVGTEKLEGGAASPGNNKSYGTNASGVKGFYETIPVHLSSVQDGQGLRYISANSRFENAPPRAVYA